MPPRRGQGLLNAEQLANESFECDDEDVLPPFAGPPACSALEITGFIKKGGLLTKRISLSSFFFFYCYGDHRVLHSFPTRRSSDLNHREKPCNDLPCGHDLVVLPSVD